MVFGQTPNGGLPLSAVHGDSTTNVNPATLFYSEREPFGFGSSYITCHYQSITSVPFYRTWSFEELRLQNHVLKSMADGFRHTVAALKGGPMLHPPPTVTKQQPIVSAPLIPGNTYSKGSYAGFTFGTSIPVGFNEQKFRPGVGWSFGPTGPDYRQQDGAFGTGQPRGFSGVFSGVDVYGAGAQYTEGSFGSSTSLPMGFNHIAYPRPSGASNFTGGPLGFNFKAIPRPPGSPGFGESHTISNFPPVGSAGTIHPPYQQTVEAGPDIPVETLFHSITAMDAYRGFSVEELRLQDYRRMGKC